MEWRTRSEGETREIGRTIGRACRPGDVIALYGGLGAGKTALAQGVLEGLGCPGPHPSPTFTLVRQYAGRLPAVHADLYRLGSAAVDEDLGWDEIFGGDGVAVVEWADYLEGGLPAERVDVRLRRVAGADGAGDASGGERRIELTGRGDAGRRLESAVRQAVGP